MIKPTDTIVLASLKTLQKNDGCLLPDRIAQLADHLRVSESHLYGVATFYSLLNTGCPAKYTIRICNSISCHLGESDDLLRVAERILGILPGQTSADAVFRLETAGCLGACGQGPAVLINDRLHTHVDPETLTHLVSELKESSPHECASEQPRVWAIGEPLLSGSPTDDLSIDQFTPQSILAEVAESGLCGRGGAAFPTARKWQLCADSTAEHKYVICNADESEPGTFKDRWLLANRTDIVLRGMALAAKAVGAREGIIYLRGEYQELVETIQADIERVEIPCFTLKLITGAGAYVCGEETALLESIEGRRGVPRLRPPYPPTSGLFGYPTVINNVETFANIPLIMAGGSSRFRCVGTPRSAGTKLFCMSGDVATPGIIEAPLGTPLSDILDQSGPQALKAAIVGGASGRIVPRRDFGRRLCYEDLSPGSGAIIAVGTSRSMRDVAGNLMAFFSHESCAECSICRIGTARAYELLTGRRTVGEELGNVLESVCGTLRAGARCGLGQAASIALSDALNLFPQEFEGVAVL